LRDWTGHAEEERQCIGAAPHADPGYPLQIASDVTVGHVTMLHG
jgi:carbonic anhydrase/acetyltransferase-like protein (isoleucine patch superfamily)